MPGSGSNLERRFRIGRSVWSAGDGGGGTRRRRAPAAAHDRRSPKSAILGSNRRVFGSGGLYATCVIHWEVFRGSGRLGWGSPWRGSELSGGARRHRAIRGLSRLQLPNSSAKRIGRSGGCSPGSETKEKGRAKSMARLTGGGAGTVVAGGVRRPFSGRLDSADQLLASLRGRQMGYQDQSGTGGKKTGRPRAHRRRRGALSRLRKHGGAAWGFGVAAGWR